MLVNPMLINQIWFRVKTNSLNMNENMNECLLDMDVSWLMFAFVAFAMLAYGYICCISILLPICMFSCCLLSLVGADRVCFAFGARFRVILAVYAR